MLRLVAWDGLDVREGAEVLGCSQGAFRVRLHRARRKLARRLDAAKPIDQECRARGAQAGRGGPMTRSNRTDALARMRAANPVSADELREATGEPELLGAMRRAIAVGEAPTRPIPAGDRVAIEHGPGVLPAGAGSSRAIASPRSASASPASR